MSNPHVIEQFDAMLDKRLSDVERAGVETHLSQCADCRNAWQEHSALWSKLGSLPAVEPSTGFTERVMRNLDTAPQPSRAPFEWSPAWKWAMATATVVMLALVFTMNRQQQQPLIASAPTEQREEYKVAENLDMLQDFEMIAVLDLLEK